MINALLIDQELPAINQLADQLGRTCPEIKIHGKADSLGLAHQLIAELHPQIVFMDIAWPDAQGFSFLRQFQPRAFETVIVTGDQLYAALRPPGLPLLRGRLYP